MLLAANLSLSWVVPQLPHVQTLIQQEPQAWPSGPLYVFSGTAVLTTDAGRMALTDSQFADITGPAIDALTRVLDKFSALSADELANRMREPQTPWHITKSRKGFRLGGTIRHQDSKAYFDGFSF